MWTFFWDTHTHTFNGPLSRTTRVIRYQKGETNLDFTEARDTEWQWHQLGHMQVCTSLQTDNHTSTPPLSFLQAGCHSCHPTNSVKALKAQRHSYINFSTCYRAIMHYKLKYYYAANGRDETSRTGRWRLKARGCWPGNGQEVLHGSCISWTHCHCLCTV